MPHIEYKKGYKYQLYTQYELEISITPDSDVETPFIALTAQGKLTIKKGYAWDGPSGPAVDTDNFMRGSLVHDALYELMRYDELDPDTCKHKADQIMKELCIQDGMSKLRAWWVFKGVDWFGGRSTKRERPVHTAP